MIALLTDYDRWRFATLKPFGDPTVSGDWEIYDTPQIEVLGKY